MKQAYNEIYLDDAMKNLGEAVDFAVNSCNLSIEEFFNLFIATGMANHFGKGSPKVISGLSGTELMYEIVDKSGMSITLEPARREYEYSSSYWCGWIIAYYQWKTGKSFKEIFGNMTADELERLYTVFHEASEERVADAIDAIIRKNSVGSKLQKLRKNCNYSQRELAEKAGINLRTLQQYEIKAKDINKASSGSLLALARVLGCEIEDLME